MSGLKVEVNSDPDVQDKLQRTVGKRKSVLRTRKLKVGKRKHAKKRSPPKSNVIKLRQ